MDKAYCHFVTRFKIDLHTEDHRFEACLRRVVRDNKTGELVLDSDCVDEGNHGRSRDRAIAIFAWLAGAGKAFVEFGGRLSALLIDLSRWKTVVSCS